MTEARTLSGFSFCEFRLSPRADARILYRMREYSRFIFLAVTILVVYFMFTTIKPTRRPGRKLVSDRPLIIAHRCGALPENTVAGCRRTFESGVADFLDLDVWLTKDKQLAVIHDQTLERTTDGKGRVEDFTLAQLAKFDAGYSATEDGKTFPYRGKNIRIEPIEAFFDAFPKSSFYIEIKSQGDEPADLLVQVVEKKGMTEHVVVGAFRRSSVARVQEKNEAIAVTGAFFDTLVWTLLERANLTGLSGFGADVLAVPIVPGILPVDAAYTGSAHRQNLRVHVWTVNDETTMRRLLAANVDGILTDRPEILASVLRREKKPSPEKPGLKAAQQENK